MPLTPDQVLEFREEGVLVAEGMLTDGDLQPLIEECAEWIDRKARALQAEGAISDACEGEPFDRRAAMLYAQSPRIMESIDLMEARGPAAFAFMRRPALMDVIESLIGAEITCSPIQHLRAKPPAAISGGGTGFYNVPWHQDAAVTWEEADESDIVTCWVPLVDATVDNGCMEVMPGAWKLGYLAHQPEGGTSIRPELLPDITPRPVPAPKGSVVLMHRWTPHRSTPNRTDRVRWSVDLRYQPTGTPTGRPFHPAFVAHSRRDPASVLTDHAEWARRWEDALLRSRGVKAHRV
jgi:hypothetical protein